MFRAITLNLTICAGYVDSTYAEFDENVYNLVLKYSHEIFHQSKQWCQKWLSKTSVFNGKESSVSSVTIRRGVLPRTCRPRPCDPSSICSHSPFSDKLPTHQHKHHSNVDSKSIAIIISQFFSHDVNGTDMTITHVCIRRQSID